MNVVASIKSMESYRKVKGEFLVRNVKGTSIVLKHVDSQTVTVAEPGSSYYSNDKIQRLIDNLEEDDMIEAQIVNPNHNEDYVWVIADVNGILPNQT